MRPVSCAERMIMETQGGADTGLGFLAMCLPNFSRCCRNRADGGDCHAYGSSQGGLRPDHGVASICGGRTRDDAQQVRNAPAGRRVA